MRLTCDHCGVSYERPPAQVDRTGSGRHFCSRPCAGASRKLGRQSGRAVSAELIDFAKPGD